MMKRIIYGLYTVIFILLVAIVIGFYNVKPKFQFHTYKYTITTHKATYCCDSIEHYPNNVIGFHNSNGTFIQIK